MPSAASSNSHLQLCGFSYFQKHHQHYHCHQRCPYWHQHIHCHQNRRHCSFFGFVRLNHHHRPYSHFQRHCCVSHHRKRFHPPCCPVSEVCFVQLTRIPKRFGPRRHQCRHLCHLRNHSRHVRLHRRHLLHHHRQPRYHPNQTQRQCLPSVPRLPRRLQHEQRRRHHSHPQMRDFQQPQNRY